MNKYLQKYQFQTPKINAAIHHDIGMIVVIPCFNELNLIETLVSLNGCIKPQSRVEVVVVINQSETVDPTIAKVNSNTHQEVLAWANENTLFYTLHVLFEDSLPKKHAGVGLARKIGMDEAVNRLHLADNKEGIIVCLDADCTVSNNYLIEIENHFNSYPKSPGCSIKFEHPLEGDKFKQENYEGIVNYELFLRYYNLGLRYANLPYGYHTVGSSMAVKTWAYQKQGGMNRRKAGEDFYFLHKIIALGNFTELNSCCVYPSPRTSDRVPFGTGKAINDFLNQDEKSVYYTYDFYAFEIIRDFILDLREVYESDSYTPKNKALLSFFKNIDFYNSIIEIKGNTRDYNRFKKRFFVFFDAFKVLKFVHFVRDNYYPNKEIKSQVELLLKKLNVSFDNMTKKEYLYLLRKLEDGRTS